MTLFPFLYTSYLISYAHSSKKRLWLLRSIYSPDNNQSISHYVNYYYRESFDSVFEPHGGIEVAICLLGEVSFCGLFLPYILSPI